METIELNGKTYDSFCDKIIEQCNENLKLREQVKDYEQALENIRQPFNNETNYIDRAVRAQEKAWDVLKKWGGV